MMTPDIEKIEHLLNAKSFEELSSNERELVLAHFSGMAEYEHMRETLQRVKKVFVAEAAALQTDAAMKEQILNRFEQNKPIQTSLFDKISPFFQQLIPSPTIRFASVLAVVIVIFSVGFFIWPSQQPEMAQITPIEKSAGSKLKENSFPSAPSEMVTDELVKSEDAVSTTVPMESENITEETAVAMEKYAAHSEGDKIGEDYVAPSPVAAGNAVTEDLKAPLQQNQVYRNDDGYYQYNNARVAEASPGKAERSDAYKDYTSKAKKIETKNQKSPNIDQTVASEDYEKKEEQRVSTTTSTGKTNSSASLDGLILNPSIPSWPGLSESADVYSATLDKMKEFFQTETANKYNSNQRVESLVSIKITFSEKGKVRAVNVNGNITDLQKKAIEKRAFQLPTFQFSKGSENVKVLVQTYSMYF